MQKKFLFTLAAVFTLVVWIQSPVAGEQVLFDSDFTIKKGRIHFWHHVFESDEKGDAIIKITKNTPDWKISHGFVLLNKKIISLRAFLRSKSLVLEDVIKLKRKNRLIVYLRGKRGASINISIHKEPSVLLPPEVIFYAQPTEVAFWETSTLTWSSTNADTLVIDNGIGSVGLSGSLPVNPQATTTYTLTASGAGGTTQAGATVTVTAPLPSVGISADPAEISAGDSTTLSWTSAGAQSAYIDSGVGSVALNGSIQVAPQHSTTFTLTVSGPTGSASAQVWVLVKGEPAAPQAGSFAEAYQDTIPVDVTIEAYDTKRFALITGRVLAPDASALEGVLVTIHNHPQYGTVTTDSQGWFSIPVEGGGILTVVYRRSDRLTAHRKVNVPYNDIAIAETVHMIARDPATSSITFNGDAATVITHQSTAVIDEFGTRSCSVVVKGDNRAFLLDEKGDKVNELPTITLRATEYETPESMPAVLPPASAYTYCAELDVEGVARVGFENPVVTWVDNFLGFDVGTAVPVGYYDRDRGFWVPSDNGIVVRLLDTDGDGSVDALDATNDGNADDLNGNGSFNDEVIGLGDPGKYTAGTTYWRVALSHFSPVDWNWPRSPPADAVLPNPQGASVADQQKQATRTCKEYRASFTEERSRILHEDIGIPGTDMTLHYAGNRVQGYKAYISVPAGGKTVPASLKRIIVKVSIAGRTLEQVLNPLPDQVAEITWDGKDHLGNRVTSATAYIGIGFVYDALHNNAGNFAQAFAQVGGSVTQIRTREELILWKHDKLHIGSMGSELAEGWTLSLHHRSNPVDPILFKGDGTILENNNIIITTLAGDGTMDYGGDGGPATQARLSYPNGVATDSAGNIYIADLYNNRIRKVDTSGIITTIAGTGAAGFSGDGGPAILAEFNTPGAVAVDAAGNIYIADGTNVRVRKVATNGIVTTIAGTGVEGFSGDGGPAVSAMISPSDIAVDADGNLYIADLNNARIRKVDTNGIITTLAGMGGQGYFGDGEQAKWANFYYPKSVAADSAGNIYVADWYNHRIRKIDSSGIITTVAGDGTPGYGGDGGLATQAQINYPEGVEVDAAGNIFIADNFNQRIRKVDTYGIITTLAGNGIAGYGGDGGPATQAILRWPSGVAVDAAGNIFIADIQNNRIRKVGPSADFLGGRVFAEPGGIGHIMSAAGLHQHTIDLDTGVILYNLGYDAENRLISITDRFANRITVTRDANGIPASITSADGLITGLSLDGNNNLTHITYPDGSNYVFEYTAEGLMTAKTDPAGNRFTYQFDSNGRLTDISDQEEGHWNYTRSLDANGDITTVVTSAEGNTTTYLDHTYSTGAYTSSITDPTGAVTLFTESADKLSVDKSLPCGMDLNFTYGLDPIYKFGFIKEMKEATESGLERTIQAERKYEDTDFDHVPDLISETVTLNAKTTTLANNVLASKKTITSPAGRIISAVYAPDSLRITSLNLPGLYDTFFGYDPRGRLTSIDTDQRSTGFTYNAQGFLETVSNPLGRLTSYTYDAVGRVTEIDRPDGSTVGFSYDDNGNMTVLTNPAVSEHTFEYNQVNLNNSYQPPLSGSYSYLYDKDRRLVRTKFPSGRKIDNIYADVRLVQIQTPEGNIDFTYLCGTKVDTLSKGLESIDYDYDGKLVLAENLSGTLNHVLTYSYNKDFNVSSFTYGGGTVNYTYDDDGLLIGSGGFAITRNAENGLPQGVSDGVFNLTRTFNGYGEVAGQYYAIKGESKIGWSLARDKNGSITKKTEIIAGVSTDYAYTYDPLGRLLSVTKAGVPVEQYSYNANGGRINETNQLRGIADKSFSYSIEDHLLTAGAAVYEYDVDGFLTTKTKGPDVTDFLYSSRGELLSVTLPDMRVIKYVYDPLGRRIAKGVGASIDEKYLWQGLTRLLAVYDGSDNLKMRFVYADDRMPVSMQKGLNNYYLAYDQVGSLRIVADESGNIVKRIEYDSFGNVIHDTNPAFEVPFGFAGGLHDTTTGLVRFGYRDYDPDTGRWTAKDPILFAGGNTDLYGYCLNDPINFVDPLGLIRWYTVGKGALATFGGGVAVVGGAFASTTGVGAIGGVPAVLVGSAGVGWGVSQMVAGFTDNEIPFMGTKEAIIKSTTEPGLLQDELLGANSLGDMLLTGRTAPTDIGKINSALQSGYSIYKSGSKIVESLSIGKSGSSPCP